MKISTFTELYERAVAPNGLISPFISGHLVVEFLLRKIIQTYDPTLMALSEDLTHARLINLTHEIGGISKEQKDVLSTINKIRNKIAHDIVYFPSLGELKALFSSASSAFTDMTDGMEQGSAELRTAVSTDDLEDWVIKELFIQIAYDLHGVYQSRGGHYEDFH